MENTIIKDDGMGIKEMIVFFFFFTLLLPIPIMIAENLLKFIGPTAANTGAFATQLGVYILLVKKLKKDYNLNLKLNFDINAKFYIFIILIWVGYRLTYDNSIAILVERLSPNSWIHEALEKINKYPITALFSVCIVAPIFEEIFCRGYVLDKLAKRYSKNKALILSALFFAILHMNLIQGVNTFLMGIFLGAIYLKTNSLIPCIVLHFVNNTFGGVFSVGGFSYVKLVIGGCILVFCGYIVLKDKRKNQTSVANLEI